MKLRICWSVSSVTMEKELWLLSWQTWITPKSLNSLHGETSVTRPDPKAFSLLSVPLLSPVWPAGVSVWQAELLISPGRLRTWFFSQNNSFHHFPSPFYRVLRVGEEHTCCPWHTTWNNQLRGAASFGNSAALKCLWNYCLRHSWAFCFTIWRDAINTFF